MISTASVCTLFRRLALSWELDNNEILWRMGLDCIRLSSNTHLDRMPTELCGWGGVWLHSGRPFPSCQQHFWEYSVFRPVWEKLTGNQNRTAKAASPETAMPGTEAKWVIIWWYSFCNFVRPVLRGQCSSCSRESELWAEGYCI